MKLQRIYYYDNIIPIILQSIIMKKYETIIYYNEKTWNWRPSQATQSLFHQRQRACPSIRCERPLWPLVEKAEG